MNSKSLSSLIILMIPLGASGNELIINAQTHLNLITSSSYVPHSGPGFGAEINARPELQVLKKMNFVMILGLSYSISGSEKQKYDFSDGNPEFAETINQEYHYKIFSGSFGAGIQLKLGEAIKWSTLGRFEWPVSAKMKYTNEISGKRFEGEREIKGGKSLSPSIQSSIEKKFTLIIQRPCHIGFGFNLPLNDIIQFKSTHDGLKNNFVFLQLGISLF